MLSLLKSDIPPHLLKFFKPRTVLKPKDDTGLPWRTAFALQADGWYLRSDIIWSKPNPLPESVEDRPTRSHEYLFLLSKTPTYYYDAVAVAVAARHAGRVVQYNGTQKNCRAGDAVNDMRTRITHPTTVPQIRNRRSVWQIPTQSYSGAHFATMPEALVEICLLAGTSAQGCCPQCGAPYTRVTKIDSHNPGNRKTNGPRSLENRHMTAGFAARLEKETTTLGWAPSCSCQAGPPVPCRVLDPFAGSGTTVLTAAKHGRQGVGVDLSRQYLAQSQGRLGLRVPLEAPRDDGQGVLFPAEQETLR